jgi:uncharacterized protein YdhG (YjbR/CyaY superfamily)
MKKPINIDEYISGFPKETQKILEQLRATIKKAAPNADEVISYSIPAFKLNGMLVGLLHIQITLVFTREVQE